MKKLTKQQILLMHRELLEQTGGESGLRDEGLLEAALAAPFATFGGEDFFPSVEEKAARLGYGLIENHAMVDGNKRTGAHSMLVFLALNGVLLSYTQQELEEIILGVAAGRESEKNLLQWIRLHERKI